MPFCRLILTLTIVWAGVLAGVVSAADPQSQPKKIEPPETSTYELEKPSPEVRRAIRLLLSSSRKDQKRGQRQLLLMGKAAAPQLRYWVRGVLKDSAKVEDVLAHVEGDGGRSTQLSHRMHDFFQVKLREAADMRKRGEYRQAQKLAAALLTLDANQPQAWEIRRFVRNCAERLAARELLEPSFEVGGRVFEVGESLDIVFRLRNHHGEKAVIHLEKGVLGSVKVAVTRHFSNGDARRTEQHLVVRADAPGQRIVIGPGKTWERGVRINLDAPLPLTGVVARVQLAGRFRPTRWTTGDKNDNLSLPLPTTEFWVVPPGQVPLSDRPLQKLTAALLFDRGEAFFVGGQLAVWAGEQDAIYNSKVVETLLSHIENLEGERCARAVWFLEQATGMGFGPELEKWNDWWNRLRVADGAEPAERG